MLSKDLNMKTDKINKFVKESNQKLESRFDQLLEEVEEKI